MRGEVESSYQFQGGVGHADMEYRAPHTGGKTRNNGRLTLTSANFVKTQSPIPTRTPSLYKTARRVRITPTTPSHQIIFSCSVFAIRQPSQTHVHRYESYGQPNCERKPS